MSDERDELAELLHDNITDALPSHPCRSEIGEQVDMAVQHVLAAGYRKPQQVTTVEELDALPAGTVIRDGDPLTCCKWGDGTWGTFAGDSYPTSRITLPATVLHIGGAE